MALVNNKIDFKDFVTMPNNLSYEAMKASINFTENKFALHILGKPLYTVLNDAVAADTVLNADEALLLAEVRKMIGLMAYAHYVQLGNAKVTDQGITAVHTNNEKPAFEWQVKDIKIAAMEMAFNAIEDLLLYLESVKDTFSDWTSSEAFTEFDELFIATAIDFSKCWNINNSRLTYLALVPKIRFVEDFYIETLLSSEYVAELRTQRKANTLTAANLVIVDLLKKYIARRTIECGLDSLSVEVSVFGMVRNYANSTVNSSRPVSDSERANVIATAVLEADMYKQKIIKTLYDNIDDYATFKASDCWTDPTVDDDIPDRKIKNFGTILRT